MQFVNRRVVRKHRDFREEESRHSFTGDVDEYADPGPHLFIGGELLPGSTAMWGPASLQQLENMRINVAVFGAGAVMNAGIYASSSYAIELKRKMRSVAAEAFFVADSTKFGREALFKVFGFEDFTAGITDDAIDPIRAARWPIPLIRARTADEFPNKEHLI